MKIFLLLLLSTALVSAVDYRKIPCKHAFGNWDCWYNQTCSNTLYQCDGHNDNAPPFSPIAFGWIIFAGVVGSIIVIALIAVLVVCLCLKKKICCC